MPSRAALLVGQDNMLDVMVRAKAPEAFRTAKERLPLNLAIVLDRSGSMAAAPNVPELYRRKVSELQQMLETGGDAGVDTFEGTSTTSDIPRTVVAVGRRGALSQALRLAAQTAV